MIELASGTTATNSAAQVLLGGLDCLDTTPATNAYSDDGKPGAAEACDGFDTDCSTGTATNAGANEIDDVVDRYLECGTFVAGSTVAHLDMFGMGVVPHPCRSPGVRKVRRLLIGSG